MIVLVPAYEPDERLVALVAGLRDAPVGVVVVDDGSGPDFAPVFDAAAAVGADVIRHDVNRGKGCALKSGFAHVAATYGAHDVVCADGDGQHLPGDILAVAGRLGVPTDDGSPERIVLGCRSLGGPIPWKSRIGNDLTRVVFRLTTGVRLADTQTGLRAYPSTLVGWLQTIPGRRYEYEMDVLLAATRAGIELVAVPIETVYVDGNARTHFDPLRDSVRVLLPFVRFSVASLSAFVIDTVLLLALVAATGRLASSVVVARLVSAAWNYTINRRYVFAAGPDRAGASGNAERRRDAAVRYALLAGALLALNYAVLRALTGWLSVPLLPAKILTELSLFVTSYGVQQRVVFRAGRRAGRGAVESSQSLVPSSNAQRKGRPS